MKLLSVLEFFFGRTIFKLVSAMTIVAILLWLMTYLGVITLLFSFFLYIILILLSSVVIWRAGDFFAPATEFIESHHNIPQSVKAAVIDAIASSFPEFAVAIIAVLLIGKAEVGVATVIGSALYNVLIIPAASGLVAVTPMLISHEVVWRDSVYYLVTVILLTMMILIFPEWGVGVAVIFLITYIGYILLLQKHYHAHQELSPKEQPETQIEEDETLQVSSEREAWLWIVGMMILMGIASYILVEASIKLGNILGIHEVIMAFIVIAAGTSVPDTVISVLNAKRGNYDAAISNVFGSNIFDICICLSVPILLAFAINGEATTISLPQTGLILSLIGSTFLAIYLFYSNNYTLTKTKCKVMAGVYGIIFIYALTID